MYHDIHSDINRFRNYNFIAASIKPLPHGMFRNTSVVNRAVCSIPDKTGLNPMGSLVPGIDAAV